MPKINQEEYEVLKEKSNVGYEWIARDESGSCFIFELKPIKDHRAELWEWVGSTRIGKIFNSSLFQFIQWEDSEPYNIQELIEEYEEEVDLKEQISVVMNRLEEVCGIAMKEVGRVFGGIGLESEETEVKKDIEWLKSSVQLNLDFYNDSDEEWQIAKVRAYAKVLELIDQLDEPDEREQLETAYKDILSRGEFWFDDKKYVVVEKPSIPQFVADWLEKYRDCWELYVSMEEAMNYKRFDGRTRKSDAQSEEMKHWLLDADNQELYVRAWLDGYEVAEEQKYIVSDNSSVPLLIKNDDGKVMSYDSQIAYNNDNGTIKLTEQEIKDYDPRYMTFAKPVEEMEE